MIDLNYRGIGVLCAALWLSGCQQTVGLDQAQITPLKGEITAVGYAVIAQQTGKTKQEKQLHAMKASKLDAYRELAEQVYGIEMQSEQALINGTLQDNAFSAALSGIIRGAKVVKSYVVGESYVTELSLDLAVMQQLDRASAQPILLPSSSELIF